MSTVQWQFLHGASIKHLADRNSGYFDQTSGRRHTQCLTDIAHFQPKVLNHNTRDFNVQLLQDLGPKPCRLYFQPLVTNRKRRNLIVPLNVGFTKTLYGRRVILGRDPGARNNGVILIDYSAL